MPAKDKYHNAVKTGLEKEGWTITDDPLHIPFDETNLYIDIGAEKLFAAERKGEKIAVEVKSFSSISVLFDFHLAVGQFINYRVAVVEREHLKIIVYDALSEVITEWKS